MKDNECLDASCIQEIVSELMDELEENRRKNYSLMECDDSVDAICTESMESICDERIKSGNNSTFDQSNIL